MRCMDVMKKGPFSIGLQDTIQQAAVQMRDLNVGFLPICDASGRVVGTLTARDIAIRVAADDLVASSCCARDVMTPEVVACRATDDLARAEEVMIEHKKSRVLVTNEDGQLEGVVSLSDVAQFEGARRTGATVREITSREVRW